MIGHKNILFCTDFSEDANVAFIHALGLAKKYSARLHILHVSGPTHASCGQIGDGQSPQRTDGDGSQFDEEQAKRVKAALKEAYENRLSGLKTHVFVVEFGSPDIGIIQYAKENEIDVIVMGALGKAELDKIEHGATVANVSKYAQCRVTALRNPAEQFTLPVQMY